MSASVRPFARIFGKSDEDMILIQMDYDTLQMTFTFRPGLDGIETVAITCEWDTAPGLKAKLAQVLKDLTEEEVARRVEEWRKILQDKKGELLTAIQRNKHK